MSKISFKPLLPIDIQLNRRSEAYRRMTCAGFKIGEVQVNYDFGDSLALRVSFKCVCNREEIYQRIVWSQQLDFMKHDPMFKDGWDACQEIENFGSVSVDHLRADGFSEDDIKRIRYVYDLEDEVKELRRMKQIYQAQNGIYDYR